jgi:hypothetical protein
VGLSCKGFGEELLALFRAIEASRQPIAHLLLFGKKKKKKKKKKIKKVILFHNYGTISGNISGSRIKGRAASGFFMKPRVTRRQILFVYRSINWSSFPAELCEACRGVNICKRNGEFVDHLLLHCEVACAPWNAIFSLFEMS